MIRACLPMKLVVVDGTEKLREGSKVEVQRQNDLPVPVQGGIDQPSKGAEKPRKRDAAVNPSRLFILRPVATALLMAAILLAGFIAYRQLPVSALPQVDYPTIQVLTFYPGASPDVMASSVTAPLERQFGQMPGLNQMTSTSSGGSSVITLQFSLELNLDVAEQEVQAAINGASTFLPRDLPSPPVYSKVNPADAPILTLALTSHTLPLSQVEDLAETRFAQKISQLSGVGLVSISGGQRPAVRIQANPRALSAYGLTLEDLRVVVAAANVNQAKGAFDGPKRASIINATDQLLSSKEYQPLIVTYRNGAPVHLSDVADCDRRCGERQTGGLDERGSGGDRQHPASTGRQCHRRRGPHQETTATVAKRAAFVRPGDRADGSHDLHSRVGPGRAV